MNSNEPQSAGQEEEIHNMTPNSHHLPEIQGLDASKLDAYVQRLAERRSKAVMVIRHDEIVREWYADDHSPEKPHYTASLAKTLVGGLALAAAASEGYIGYDDPACEYIPQWRDDPVKSAITIRHLATHTSGLAYTTASNPQAEWERMFWQKDRSASAVDPITCSLELAPVVHEPGTKFLYSNPGFGALAYAITASLRNSPYPDIKALLRDKIMRPLGIPDEEWSIGYSGPFRLDGMDIYATWGGAAYTPRAVARIGQMLLHNGVWEGRTLIGPRALKPVMTCTYKSITQEGFPEAYLPTASICGFTNHCCVFPDVPDCTFFGAGAGHQVMIVIPSLDLVVVRMGESLTSGPHSDDAYWLAIKELLCDPLKDMLLHRSPYPDSVRVRRVRFEDAARIHIDGEDSDNWPTTWAADGDLYTSYGDGYGFVPHTEKKLSLGFAKLYGEPKTFKGVNLRTETGERVGDGASGPKASGLVMVDGVLYMIARNTGNAQIAWSEDNGKTWEWGFRFETSFGCPTFVNYGQNYAGAPDDYVYLYSPDGSSAYEVYDHIVLARVHRSRIRNKGDYEYFSRLDEAGRPVWTPDIEKRGPVFTFPNHCHRLESIYHAATRSYWLVVACNHEGSWGIFDAPTPWGPWSTVFYTDYWGLGRTHAYRFPTKWISEDGTKLHLVFSGRRFKTIDYDALCVREMTLETAERSGGHD
jgi:CubicO group peptidase (beta-lactamase class C family)